MIVCLGGAARGARSLASTSKFAARARSRERESESEREAAKGDRRGGEGARFERHMAAISSLLVSTIDRYSTATLCLLYALHSTTSALFVPTTYIGNLLHCLDAAQQLRSQKW
jgi:hypothetical protein